MTPLKVQRLSFLVVAIVLVLVHITDFTIEQSTAIKLLAFAVLLFGVPHGAIDPLLARRFGLWQTNLQLSIFSIVYLAIATAVVLIWIVLPVLMLGLLLLFSAWHFSGDWEPSLGRASSLSVAIALLTLPALFHDSQVNQIFSALSGDNVHIITTMMANIAPIVTVFAIFAGIKASLTDPAGGLEILTLLGSAAFLTPIWFFILYFCLLHSPKHLLSFLRTNSGPEMARTAVLFTALTFLIATMVLVFNPSTNVDEQLLQLIFIGLFALTVPHMMLNEFICTDKPQ